MGSEMCIRDSSKCDFLRLVIVLSNSDPITILRELTISELFSTSQVNSAFRTRLLSGPEVIGQELFLLFVIILSEQRLYLAGLPCPKKMNNQTIITPVESKHKQ